MIPPEISLWKLLWSEDECTRNTEGHEDIAAAWLRLFGQPDFYVQWDAAKPTEIDRGDSFIRTLPNGMRVVLSFDGYSIYTETL